MSDPSDIWFENPEDFEPYSALFRRYITSTEDAMRLADALGVIYRWKDIYNKSMSPYANAKNVIFAAIRTQSYTLRELTAAMAKKELGALANEMFTVARGQSAVASIPVYPSADLFSSIHTQNQIFAYLGEPVFMTPAPSRPTPPSTPPTMSKESVPTSLYTATRDNSYCTTVAACEMFVYATPETLSRTIEELDALDSEFARLLTRPVASGDRFTDNSTRTVIRTLADRRRDITLDAFLAAAAKVDPHGKFGTVARDWLAFRTTPKKKDGPETGMAEFELRQLLLAHFGDSVISDRRAERRATIVEHIVSELDVREVRDLEDVEQSDIEAIECLSSGEKRRVWAALEEIVSNVVAKK